MDVLHFNYQANKARLTERARAMARMVLVDGVSQVEVARRFGVKQPRVAYLVACVRNPPIRGKSDGLVRIGGLVSPETAAKVREVIAHAKAAKAARAAQEAAGREQAVEEGETYSGGEIVSPDDW